MRVYKLGLNFSYLIDVPARSRENRPYYLGIDLITLLTICLLHVKGM